MKRKPPSAFPGEGLLESSLGPSMAHWRLLWDCLKRDFPEVGAEWKRSTNDFGGYCVARDHGRALLYLIPHRQTFEAAIVLGERAVAIALADTSLGAKRALIAAAPKCAAGKTVRFVVNSRSDVLDASRLVAIKTTPKKTERGQPNQTPQPAS